SNLTWQRAEYTKFSYVDAAGVFVDYRGNLMNNAPEWQFGASMEYEYALAGGGTLAPRIDAAYKSRVYFNETNAFPYDAPGTESVNLALRYTASSEQWSWRVYVDNVTDRQPRLYAFQGLPNIVGVFLAQPRTVG